MLGEVEGAQNGFGGFTGRVAFGKFAQVGQHHFVVGFHVLEGAQPERRVVAPDPDGEPKYTDRLNGPIQSTAGDILYLTMEKMAADPRPGVHFLLSVHDELVLECPEEDAREVALWLKEKMRSSIEDVLGKDLGGEKSVEVSYGPSWGETTEGV